jgi:hypothetical protein
MRHQISRIINSIEQSINHLVKTFPPPFMEPEVSLPCSQQPPLVRILSQINPFRTFSTHSFKIRSNITFLSTPRSSAWSLPSGCLTKLYVCVCIYTYPQCVLHYPPISLSLTIWWCVEVMKHLPLPLRSKYSHRCSLKHQHLCTCPSVRDQMPHP